MLCRAIEQRGARERLCLMGRDPLEQRPNKVRDQSPLLFGGRTFWAESTVQAKALRWVPNKENCAGVSDSMAGALVSTGHVWCELGQRSPRARSGRTGVPIRTLYFILSLMAWFNFSFLKN